MSKRLITISSLIFIIFQLIGCSKETTARAKLAKDVATVGIQVKGAQRKLKINEQVVLPISVFNNGVALIPSRAQSDGNFKVVATYHWLKATGEMAVWDGIRTSLPEDIGKGKSIDVMLTLKAPPVAGKYLLTIDLVQEGALWFADTGSQTATMAYNIE